MKFDLGLLLLRLVFGGFMLVGHGLSKAQRFTELSTSFLDPLGIGAMPSLLLTLVAEVGFAALVVVGAFTRFATIPLIITMGVAAFLVHASDPFFMPAKGAKEPAVLFLVGYLALLIMGPGKISVDGIFRKIK